jgi:hypothetical protein
MATAAMRARTGIKDVFYETRVLMGRGYTLRRFAAEALGGHVEPMMLGCIEKGTRFPSDALVRRLAAIRKQDPQELLALLWRDRIIYAIGRELRRVLHAPRGVSGIEDADLAVLVSQAIAALPEGEAWTPVARWRQQYRTIRHRRGKTTVAPDALVAGVETALRQRDLVEVRAGKVRRRGYHFVAQSTSERLSLALEFCTLFAKGLLDKLVLSEEATGTYLRNHYLHIDPARMPEFQRRLDEALAKLADEFAIDASARARFLNVLVTATPF